MMHANYMLTSFTNLRSHFIPPQPLHPTTFRGMVLDVMGTFTLKSSIRRMYILVVTNYFFKWAEAVALKEVKKENIVDFIWTYIIY